MPKGKVKWYNDTKGFGFIESESNEDIFVHRTGISEGTYALKEGQEVEFEIREGEKGLVAFNVKALN
ncbi:Cold shock protein CspD [subsurface metagenome]